MESGIPSPTVSARQTGNYIIVTAATSTWYGSGTLQHYFVAVNGQNTIYLATYVGSGGELRWIQYLNRPAMSLTPRGVTGSGIGVYMVYELRESSSGGPFFRDIEQQGTSASVEVYNYMWSAHNQTEAQRLGVLHGPYALMVAGTSTPAAPDMTFMSGLGLTGAVLANGRGWVAGNASGVTAGSAATAGWANSTAQYWATPQSNGDFASR